MENIMKHVRFFALLALLILAHTGCGGRQKSKPQLGEVDRLPRLETILPDKQTHLAVWRTYAATVDAFEKVDLCAQVRGVIKALGDDVDIGRPVRKDEVLMALDIPDIIAERDTKEAMLEQARNAKDQALQAIAVAAEE